MKEQTNNKNAIPFRTVVTKICRHTKEQQHTKVKKIKDEDECPPLTQQEQHWEE